MSDKKETEEPGLTTEEAKELELDEQPKPTRKHGLILPLCHTMRSPVDIIKKRQKKNQIARNQFSSIADSSPPT